MCLKVQEYRIFELRAHCHICFRIEDIWFRPTRLSSILVSFSRMIHNVYQIEDIWFRPESSFWCPKSSLLGKKSGTRMKCILPEMMILSSRLKIFWRPISFKSGVISHMVPLGQCTQLGNHKCLQTSKLASWAA